VTQIGRTSVAFPNHSNVRRGFSGNTRQAEGQSGEMSATKGKFLP